jgi:rRNA biogenesis protein RRP5
MLQISPFIRGTVAFN